MTAIYTTQLGAGQGLIRETLILLDLWQAGMSGTDLYRAALASGLFSTLSARRLHDMITVGFAPRYLRNGGAPALLLKQVNVHFARKEFEQLLFLYTCRVHAILADFIRQVYWPAYTVGKAKLGNDEARAFVMAAVREGKTTVAWSEIMLRRVASNLTGCCADFGLLDQGAKAVRKILPYRIEPTTVAMLAYDLHFAGHGDNSVIHHEDWALFGLEPTDVLEELKRLALRNWLIVQTAGGVVRMGWQCKTMEELTDVLTQR